MARKSVFRAGRSGNGGKPQGAAYAALAAWRRDIEGRLAALAPSGPKAKGRPTGKGKPA